MAQLLPMMTKQTKQRRLVRTNAANTRLDRAERDLAEDVDARPARSSAMARQQGPMERPPRPCTARHGFGGDRQI